MTMTLLMVTLAVVVALSVGLLATALHREKRRMHRQAGNLCAVCGYDLRATQGACSECGAPPDIQKQRNLSAPLDLVKLHRDWPISPIDPSPPEASELLTAVYVTSDQRVADLLAEQFGARGQWCSRSAESSEEVRPGMALQLRITTFS